MTGRQAPNPVHALIEKVHQRQRRRDSRGGARGLPFRAFTLRSFGAMI
jgi:hypothetical protein